jgi:hypothetical protein
MKVIRRSAVGLAVALGLWISLSTPAFAGYGNHAERATANIMTRIEIARISIVTEIAEIQAVAEAKRPTGP